MAILHLLPVHRFLRLLKLVRPAYGVRMTTMMGARRHDSGRRPSLHDEGSEASPFAWRHLKHVLQSWAEIRWSAVIGKVGPGCTCFGAATRRNGTILTNRPLCGEERVTSDSVSPIVLG